MVALSYMYVRQPNHSYAESMFHLHSDHTCTFGCVVAGLLHSELSLKLSQTRVQCNLDYPDLIYPEPRLSGLTGHQTM